MNLRYAELYCISNFSFLKGASHPEELIEHAAELGYSALALTDECSVAGVVRAYAIAKEINFSLIIGSHFWINSINATLVVLAQNREGYGDLCAAISRARNRTNKGNYVALVEDFCSMRHCIGILVCDESTTSNAVLWHQSCFSDRAALGCALHRNGNDHALITHVESLGAIYAVPRVALGGVQFHVRKRKVAHDVLTAIRKKRPLSQCGADVLPNSEPHLRTRRRLAALYPLDWLLRTTEIAALCTFDLKELSYEYPREIVPERYTPTTWLRACTALGAKKKYPKGIPSKVAETIEHELQLIEELKVEAFFLTVYDIVNFARSRNILCQGRGSAANSAVCFCLGITEVDPDRTTVLFERFLSRERDEPPDIDVDFEHERREEVIQYIYQKYGRHRAALAASVICYRSKSALRDSGKALGLSLDQIDRLCDVIAWWDGHHIKPERLEEAGLDPTNDRIHKVLDVANELKGFPRHLSQHVGGFVIARDDLTRLVPIENASMPDRTVIQWDKDDLETMRLLKVDILALGVLTAIRKTFEIINLWQNNKSNTLTVGDIPDHDQNTFDMISRGDTVGVFQIESRAQMAMLPRLRPQCYYDLVIEVALVRPGPITGNMVHPYLRRRNGLEAVSYPSKAVRSVLERTLGVSIFQEQVMQLAVVAAGFTRGEADLLRRAMATWKKNGGLEVFKKKLILGMSQRGYAQEWAEQIYKQICGFGEYGFPESHAASFALLAYQSAWLKCHFPAAFAAGLINSYPMGFYTPSQIAQDVERHGVTLLPVDVCFSDWDCTLEAVGSTMKETPALRLGLRLVSGLGRATAQKIVKARRQAQFKDGDDLAQRAQLNRKEFTALTRADAIKTLDGHRRQAYWSAIGFERNRELVVVDNSETEKPNLPIPTLEDEIEADYQSIGMSLRAHPMSLLRPHLERQRFACAKDLLQARQRQIVRVCGLVTCRQRPKTAKGVLFVTLEDETGMINIVVWPHLVDTQREVLLQARLLTVFGHIQRDRETIHVVAGRLRDDSSELKNLQMQSRDFH